MKPFHLLGRLLGTPSLDWCAAPSNEASKTSNHGSNQESKNVASMVPCVPVIFRAFSVFITYCNLNNLSQEQLKMIMLLSYLFKLAFYKGDKFQEYISQCQVQWIICSTFIQTTIYHGGRTNYSENCHRALCAIYFDLLGEGTTGFSFDECLDPARCPLDSAREDYVPSTELRLRRDEMEDGSSTGAEHQVNNLRRNANDNALGSRVWVASRNVAECLE